MTLTLELPAAVEAALASEAQRRGITPEQVAADDLLQRYAEVEPLPNALAPKTGADLLAIWEAEGAFLLPQEGDLDSPERARQIREAAWRRQ